MRVLLLYPDLAKYRPAGYDRAWAGALRELGCEVDVMAATPDAWARSGPPAGRWDLVVPHVLIEDVVECGPGLRAAAVLEAAGAALLNSVSAIIASSDKLVTHAAWAAHGLPQPRTWALDSLERWPVAEGADLVLKPAWGDGARHLACVRSLAAARAAVEGWRADERRGGESRGPALVQERIAEPVCGRIFATPHRTSKVYEKQRRPGALVTHGTVYAAVREPPAAVADLARAAVAALGGGLMGIDLLTSEHGEHLALEANAPFGFDVTDPEQGRFVARAAIEMAQRGTGVLDSLAAMEAGRASPPLPATAVTA